MVESQAVHSACTFTNIILVRVHQAELSERYIGRASDWAGACGLVASKTHLLAAGPSMALIASHDISTHAFPDTLATTLQQDTALLTAVGWGRS